MDNKKVLGDIDEIMQKFLFEALNYDTLMKLKQSLINYFVGSLNIDHDMLDFDIVPIDISMGQTSVCAYNVLTCVLFHEPNLLDIYPPDHLYNCNSLDGNVYFYNFVTVYDEDIDRQIEYVHPQMKSLNV